MNNAWRRKFGPVVAQIMLNAGQKINNPARRATVLEVATKALAATKSTNAKASLKKAKNDMVKQRMNLMALESMDPTLVMAVLERGANATLLSSQDMNGPFKSLKSLALFSAPRIETMEAIARMLTMLLRHGAPLSKAKIESEYADTSVMAHVYHGTGRTEFLNLIKALAERGFVDAYHIITAHTIFSNVYKADRTPETWNRVLEIINKLIPTPQNGARRAAEMQHILEESLEHLKHIRPYEVEGLLRLGGYLTPQMLHAYVMGADATSDSKGQITNVKLDDTVLRMFWRSGVRVPRSYGATYSDTSFWNVIRQKLARHGLYNVAQPKPKPTRRTVRQPVKRKHPNMNASPTAKRRNVNRGA